MENVTVGVVARKMLRDIRPLFYLELPSTSSFEHMSDVPDYLRQVPRRAREAPLHSARAPLAGDAILLCHDPPGGGGAVDAGETQREDQRFH